MSETAAVEACPLVRLGPLVMDPLIWGHTENKPSLAGVLNWFYPFCVCSLPLRIHRSARWIQRRKRKRLHSDGNMALEQTVTRYLWQCYAAMKSRVALPRANIYIPDSPTCSLFSDSRWRPPLFPGSPAARPSAPPSPSSPLAGPPGSRPCLPAPATCLSEEFTHVDMENKWRKRESALVSSPSLLFITEMEQLSSAMAWLYCRFKPWVSPSW